MHNIFILLKQFTERKPLKDDDIDRKKVSERNMKENLYSTALKIVVADGVTASHGYSHLFLLSHQPGEENKK